MYKPSIPSDNSVVCFKFEFPAFSIGYTLKVPDVVFADDFYIKTLKVIIRIHKT